MPIMTGQKSNEAFTRLGHREPAENPLEFILNEEFVSDYNKILKIQDSKDHIILDSRYKEDFEHNHIAGSVNLPFKKLLNKNKTLKNPDELQKIFEGVGVEKDSKVIITC